MKRYLWILFAVLLVVNSACDKEVTSGLDDSVMSRTERLLEEYKKELIGAENGWIAYVMTNQGYYRFWMEFGENGLVIMRTDNTTHRELDGEQGSLYSVQQKQRATIVFETYSYLAVLSDPDNNISGGSGHKGLETDFEFEIDRYEEGVFYLKGRINRVNARFIQATAAQKAVAKDDGLMEEVDAIAELSGGIKNHHFANINGTKLGLLIKPRTTLGFYTQGGKAGYVQAFPRLEVGSMNILFDEPLKAEGLGITIDRLELNEAEGRYDLVAGGQKYPVEKSETAPIGLHEIFGYGKPFNKMRLYETMSSTFGYTFIDFIQLWMSGILPQSVDYWFGETDTGNPLLHVSANIEVAGRIWAFTGSFPVVFNPDNPAQFSTGDELSFEYDESKAAEQFYNAGAFGYFNNLKNKTFTIRWGENVPPAGYETETIIEFGGTTLRGGVLMQ